MSSSKNLKDEAQIEVQGQRFEKLLEEPPDIISQLANHPKNRVKIEKLDK